MATLGSLIISLEANTAAFTSAMDKAAYVTQQSANKIQRSMDNITSTIKGMVIAAVSIESISRIWEGFKGIYDAEKGLEKMAIRLGTTSSELSALQYAGKKAGMDIDVFNTSIQRMEKNISAAAIPAKNTSGLMGEMGEETAKGSEAFRNLGINVSVLKTLPLKDQLLAISERLKLIPNETDKVRIALDIFGKGGGGMVVMLKAGEQAIDDWITRGRQLGVVLDDSMVKRGADAAKAISEMKDGFKGLGITLADVVSPVVKEVTQAFTDKLIAIRAADPGLQNLTRTVKEFGEAWAEPTLNALKMGIIGGRIAGLQGAAIGAAAGFAGLTTSLKELGDALQNPVVLAFLGGAYFSRLGGIGIAAGALAGGVAGIGLGIRRQAKEYQAEQRRSLEFGPMQESAENLAFAEAARKDAQRKSLSMPFPADLFNEQSFGKPGKGGGKGGADSALRQLEGFINTMRSETAKAAGDSMATLNEWYAKQSANLKEIEAKTGESLEGQWALYDAYVSKKEKLEADFSKFVAEEADKDREQIKKDQVDKLDLQRNILNELASATPLLSQQLDIKARMLPIEQELARLALEESIERKNINPELAAELRGLQALTNQAKKYALERERWEKQGIPGGLKGWAYERQQEGETSTSKQTKQAMKSLESGISSTISKGIVGALKGEKADFEQIGWDLADAFISKTVEWGVSQLFNMIAQAVLPMTIAGTTTAIELETAGITVSTEIITGAQIAGAELIAAATEAASIMAASSSLGFGLFHSGGVIRAHGGLNLASDEVPIIAQTGERVLSRNQNKIFEAGLKMGGNGNGGGHTFNISYAPNYDRRPSGYERRRDIREMNKALASEMGRRN